MDLAQVIAVLEQVAPPRYAEPWDNVGLLVGDPHQRVTRLMLTIDYTPAVAAEAASTPSCDVIVAYHPPIFEPLKRLAAPSLIYDAIRRGVAIYSPHTALDVADGGTNDLLADVLGLVDRSPLRITDPKATQYKLVTFVPENQVQPISEALFAAGAGRIGRYSSCSFRSPGVGTFYGEQGSNPSVGQSGRLETADEVRLETVVPITRIAEVVRALRQAHSYEEPAFDLVQLAAAPEARGQGRVGTLPSPVPRPALIQQIKQGLGVEHLLVAGPTEGPVNRAAVCAGACGDLLDDALAQHADLYLTGEMRHHDALRAARAGMTVICALHSNSERAVLKRVKEQLERQLPDLVVTLSREDRDPFAIR